MLSVFIFYYDLVFLVRSPLVSRRKIYQCCFRYGNYYCQFFLTNVSPPLQSLSLSLSLTLVPTPSFFPAIIFLFHPWVFYKFPRNLPSSFSLYYSFYILAFYIYTDFHDFSVVSHSTNCPPTFPLCKFHTSSSPSALYGDGIKVEETENWILISWKLSWKSNTSFSPFPAVISVI